MKFSQDRTIKIYLVDDHKLLRESLQLLLARTDDFQVIVQSDNGMNLEDIFLQEVPDVVLMDITMPMRDGYETAKALKKQYPKLKIIFLTMHKTEETLSKAFNSGCDGYVLKENAFEELAAAIRKVMNGEVYVSDVLTPMMLNGFLADERSGHDLSDRELEIMKLLAEGYNNREIADMLGIAVKTVEVHRSNIMKKQNFKNITELVRYAVRNHIIEA